MRIPTPLAVLCVLVLGLGAAASCTGDEPAPATETSTSPASPLPTVDVPVEFVPGEWEYENNDVTVGFSWEGGALSVENASGAALGVPGVYVVTQAQDRIDGDVADAAPIADGSSVELTVTFPGAPALEDVGLVVVLFGGQNWGAMAPVIAGR